MKKTAGTVAREIWAASGISQKQLATKMGLKSQQAVFNLFKAEKGMRVDNFVKMMNFLGYDVVVRHRVNDEEIVLTAEEVESK